MSSPRVQSSDGRQGPSFRISLANQRTNRRVFSIDQQKRPQKETLEEVMSSALSVLDNEFGHILYEVDEISGIWKSNAPDARALTGALQRAVWCAVKQALLDRELRSLALTDDLTGLYNRRGFLASATQQLKLARRNAQAVLLFFCDIDNLKQINDCYGHREGDLAVVCAADALEKTFRDSDVLARLGGDEFAVLALEASSQNQEAILRRLETNLKKFNEDQSRYELTLSVGVARFDPKHPASLGELMAQADQAMYEQKRSQSKTWLNKP